MVTTNCIRYARAAQLEVLAGFPTKSFAMWTSGHTSMPLDVAEHIAKSSSIPVDDLLKAWSDRREDYIVRKKTVAKLQALIIRLNQERNYRYEQLKLPFIST